MEKNGKNQMTSRRNKTIIVDVIRHTMELVVAPTKFHTITGNTTTTNNVNATKNTNSKI